MEKKKKKKPKSHKKQTSSWKTRYSIILFFIILLGGVGFYFRHSIGFYYALYFNKKEHRTLINTPYEAKRINKIIEEYSDKTFGIDISHYQRKEDIQWDSLSLANGAITIDFVVLRATMGNRGKDKNFSEFWKLAKKHEKVRGAYHFYRPDEDPVLQANNFLSKVKLESGDLPPILDIEKIPRTISKKDLVKNLKIWCGIMEENYGKKPIIYTYYYYYKDYLRGEFEDYPIWLANYNDVSEPSTEDHWDFWQFTENGIVGGINTKVDVDIYNGSLRKLKKLTID